MVIPSGTISGSVLHPRRLRNQSLQMPPLSQIIFKKYDVDESGYLSINELAKLCNEMGHPISTDKLMLAMQILDSNGDGRFTYDEFKKWWSDEKRFHKLDQYNPQWLTAVIAHFRYFDKDKSGLIRRDELPALYDSLKAGGHKMPTLDHFMANLDVNADGSISLPKLLRSLTESQEYIDWLQSEGQDP